MMFKKIFFLVLMLSAGLFAQAQFATYNYIVIDDNLNTNTYTLTINSTNGIEFWADLKAEGDLENYVLECDVEETETSVYVIKYKMVSEGDYWQELYMQEYWEHEDQPVLFIVEQGVGIVYTTFKEFKVEGQEMPADEKSLIGFVLDE